jgi:uncharacterized zinc-type alcohol dehydrogenase-like protein
MSVTRAYAAMRADAALAPFSLKRRTVRASDVAIDIIYCGVCHSDIHQARDEWRSTTFPVVPGHEIIGRVASTGSGVTRLKPGDLVGVGCLVDSCRACTECRDGLEQFCERGATFTHNSEDRAGGGGPMTYGGYSEHIVVDESFVLRISDRLDPAAAAPLLCAGITTYSPLRQWNVQQGMKVGVVGLGGLGHVGLKLAKALGAHCVLFTRSPGKAEDARRFGADEVVVSTDANTMQNHEGSFDLVLDTVSADHDVNALLALLRRDGTLVLVGAPPSSVSVAPFRLLNPRKRFAGSFIGGIRETQEMLDFCADNNVTCDVEVIPVQKLDEAYERMLKSDVKYRFVVDAASLRV